MKSLLTSRRRVSAMFIFGLFAFFSGIILTATVEAQTSQKVTKGEWTAEYDSSKPDTIYLMFTRRVEKDGVNTSSRDLPLAELQGLTRGVAVGAKTNVSFKIVREAGTFVCEGYFSNGRGTGFWTLETSDKFVSAMRARGYDGLTEDELFSAAVNDLTTKFTDDLKTAGYDHLPFEELRRARTHDITPEFIQEVKSNGFGGLEMEELIRVRNHDINAEFINEMKSAGFENLSMEDLIRLKNHEVSLAFVNSIKAEGFKDVSADTAIRLKSHDVDRNFISRAKAQGYNVSLDEIIRLRSRGTVK